MTKRSIKLLAVTAYSLLLFGAMMPVNAAPSADNSKQEKQGTVIPKEIMKMGFLIAISVTGLAVLIGTGKSIKYVGGTHIKDDQTHDSSEELDSLDLNQEGSQKLESFPESTDSSPVNLEGFESAASAKLGNHSYETNGNGHASPAHNDLSTPAIKRNTSAKELELATSEQQLLELQKQLDRQRYQKLQYEIQQSPDFANSPTKEIDTWEVDVEIALRILSESPNNRGEVEKILLQSDRVKEWETILPEQDYKVKADEYIEKAYNWAQDLKKWREKHVSA
ncbi:MAG: hypothetical protein AB4038_18465 [Prochloraceae cyanobacterium]